MKVALLILLSLISAYLYRRGGTSAGTKWRDFGVPSIVTIAYLILGYTNPIALFLSFGLLFAACTTYHKWVGRLFGIKDNDVHWMSWMFTGLCYGLAMLPMAYVYNLWILFIVRSILLAALTCIWSEIISWDILEEGGRGFLIVSSLIIFI